MTRSDELYRRALALLPGGVNSPVRAFGAVGGTPRFIARGEGAYLVDVDGRRYVDFVCSWGAVLLGHAHPAVGEAVRGAAGRGLGFGAPTPGEVELAAAVRHRLPWLERLRLVGTGTEAAMTALRLARGWTGRDLVVKFAGCYHGHSDALLASAGSGLATFGIPGTPGVTAGTAADTLVLPYNDALALETAFAEHGERIACVIAESAPANMGVVPPQPGWGQRLRRISERHGALLVLDEVITGFRVRPGGWVDVDGVVPDLAVYGKVLGGGLPLAALGGRADVMDHLAPVGPVYQAGTLSGNPVAVAAGVAVLEAAEPAVYAEMDRAADLVAAAVSAALSAEGVAHTTNRAGNLFSVHFTDGPVTDYDSARRQSTERYAAFFHAMLDRGVYLPPSAFEAWFLTSAHTDDVLERVSDAVGPAARAAAAA